MGRTKTQNNRDVSNEEAELAIQRKKERNKIAQRNLRKRKQELLRRSSSVVGASTNNQQSSVTQQVQHGSADETLGSHAMPSTPTSSSSGGPRIASPRHGAPVALPHPTSLPEPENDPEPVTLTLHDGWDSQDVDPALLAAHLDGEPAHVRAPPVISISSSGAETLVVAAPRPQSSDAEDVFHHMQKPSDFIWQNELQQVPAMAGRPLGSLNALPRGPTSSQSGVSYAHAEPGGYRGHGASNMGRTCLHLCIERGHLTTARLLLARGANVHAQDLNGMTALHHAVHAQHIGLISTLLAAGADIDALDARGFSPVHVASQSGSDDLLAYLIDEGADIEAVST